MPASDRLNHALSLRLSERQYRHLVAQATIHGVPLSEAARQALDRDIEAQPDVPIEGNAPGDSGVPYATLLQGLELERAEEQLREAGLT